MRPFAGIAALGFAVLGAWAQEPGISEKLLTVDSGRVVTIKTQLKIPYNGEGYQIKFIRRMDASSAGDLFVLDEQNRLLQFSPEGRFVRNLVPFGKGPGELTKILSFKVSASDIVVFGTPYKFLHYDFSGRKTKELAGLGKLFDKAIGPDLQFLNFENGGYILLFERPRFKRGDAGWVRQPCRVVLISEDGRVAKEIEAFSFPYFVQSSPVRTTIRRWGRFIAEPLGNFRYAMCDALEYVIKVYDLPRTAPTAVFSRPYTPVLFPIIANDASDRNRINADRAKYDQDILGFRVLGGKILALTSTWDREKGVLVDVWDPDGRYLDSFYLALNSRVGSAHAADLLVLSAGRAYIPAIDDSGDSYIRVGSLEGF